MLCSFFVLVKDFIYFLERRAGKEKEMRRNNERGTWPPTHACAVTRSWARDISVPRLALIPPSHPSQGQNHALSCLWFLGGVMCKDVRPTVRGMCSSSLCGLLPGWKGAWETVHEAIGVSGGWCWYTWCQDGGHLLLHLIVPCDPASFCARKATSIVRALGLP